MMRTLFAGFLALFSAVGVMAEPLDGDPHANEKQVNPAPIMADKDGVIRLLANDAHCVGDSVRSEVREGEVANIGFWNNPKDIVSWDFLVTHQGKYLLQIEAASSNGAAVLMVQGVGKLAYSVPKTSSLTVYVTTTVGEVELAKGARITLTLRPVVDGWNPVNIRKVELIPQP